MMMLYALCRHPRRPGPRAKGIDLMEPNSIHHIACNSTPDPTRIRPFYLPHRLGRHPRSYSNHVVESKAIHVSLETAAERARNRTLTAYQIQHQPSQSGRRRRP